MTADSNRPIPFRQKLLGKTPLYGTLVTTASLNHADCLANCGFDWLFIDAEHGCLTPGSVQQILQTTSGRISSLVRLPANDSSWFKAALDAGADGVIVPLVNNADEARRAVQFGKYPPLGARSVGIGRAHGYGMTFGEYVKSANETISLIVQIEHIEGVENLDSILDVEGIDGVFIGPYDLSGSLNLLGDVQHPRVRESIALIREKCGRKNIPVGCFVNTPEAAAVEIKNGCSFVALSTDMSFMWNGARQALDKAKAL